ncbi:SpoIID/LytB domain-containing protein [Fictibacillus sp. 5RED26]|uniref:SpoIID/LytB domain-containing protein n=1 Tax=Fictibacillus sp. 5RED26 TaxID=2745876 RepID=UPI0018CE6856|nr:SpoIID/LytB domain-containing protein [Fictibacillus sp. 5RED26]MBH0156599.1 SpoIID/LytB domain-containing protein [Fictibacillus sp. 5RED26]
MRKGIIVFVVALLLFSVLPINMELAEATESEVAVSLIHDVDQRSSLNFSLKGSFKEVTSGKNLVAGKTYTVKVENGQLGIYDGSTLFTKQPSLSLQPAGISPSHLTTLNGKVNRSYMGTMNFKVEGKYVRPVNIVPVEEYIQGVLPGELYRSYHIHTMRSQAIIARTYLTHWLGKKTITDTTSFQRYVGYSMDYHNFIKAVIETKGKILTYNGKTIDAVYSSSNGGYSETNTGAWPGGSAVDLPYFPAKSDSYDMKSQDRAIIAKSQFSLTGLQVLDSDQWWGMEEKNKVFASQLKRMFLPNEHDAKVVDVNLFAISDERTKGNRIKSANVDFNYIMKDSNGKVITDENGSAKKFRKQLTLTSTQFKYALEINSTLVTAFTPSSSQYQIDVVGNGHGVGMSQTGANVMAIQGKGFREILAFYYPGTTITNDKTVNIPTTALQLKGTINYEGTNIRTSPTGSVITTGKLGQAVTVIGKSGAFFKVKIGTTIGYVNEHYVTIDQTISYKNGITPITSGQVLYLGSPVVSKNNTLYLPLPGLASRYKMKLSSTSSTFTVVDGSRKVAASHLSKYATVNGKKILLTAKPEKYYNKVYVPLAFLKQTGLVPSYYEEKAEQVLWINK